MTEGLTCTCMSSFQVMNCLNHEVMITFRVYRLFIPFQKQIIAPVANVAAAGLRGSSP